MTDSNAVRRNLRAQIAIILRNTCSAAIDFYLAGVRVNGFYLLDVAQAVEGYQGRASRLYPIRVVVNPAVRRHQHYDAMYHGGSNVFTFASQTISGDHEEALVVHEAVHASFDIRSVRLRQVDNEAAAYLAQAIYYLNKGNPAPTNPRPIFAAAYDLAHSVRRGFENVTESAARPLRQAILSAPNYQHIRGHVTHGDGIAG